MALYQYVCLFAFSLCTSNVRFASAVGERVFYVAVVGLTNVHSITYRSSNTAGCSDA